MNLDGWTHKFTIGGIDCYLKIGTVGFSEWFDYPHLSIGEICYLDLTISNRIEEMRAYEVLMELANVAIKNGSRVEDVAAVLRGHKFEPAGVTSNENIPMAASICDYIGRYLESKTKKEGTKNGTDKTN